MVQSALEMTSLRGFQFIQMSQSRIALGYVSLQTSKAYKFIGSTKLTGGSIGLHPLLSNDCAWANLCICAACDHKDDGSWFLELLNKDFEKLAWSGFSLVINQEQA